MLHTQTQMTISLHHEYVFVVNNGAITWRSKKQTTIALSSTEAEYIALSEAGCEVCWLGNLYEELGYTPEITKLT